MRSFAEWYWKQEQQLNEALPRVARGGELPWWAQIPGAKGAASAIGRLTGKGAIDWESAAQQAAERQARGREAASKRTEITPDPTTQKKKLDAAQTVFRQALKQITSSTDVLKAARKPIESIAHAFIIGGELVPNYALEIMMAAHADKDVGNQTLRAYFDDPAVVFRFFQQVLSANQSLWYDVDTNQKYAPRFRGMNKNYLDEITASKYQWEQSPFRRRELDADADDDDVSDITDTPADFAVRYLTREKLEGAWSMDEIERLWDFYANEMKAAGMSVPGSMPNEDRSKLAPYAKS